MKPKIFWMIPAVAVALLLACGADQQVSPPPPQQTWYPAGGPGPGNGSGGASDAGDDGSGWPQEEEGTGGGAGGGSGGGGGGGGSSSTTCRNEFSTGSTFNVGDTVLGPCNALPPTNCLNGTFIWMEDTSECFCAPRCDAFATPKNPGEACSSSGQNVCQTLSPRSGLKPANFCIPTSWNLCQ